MKWLLVLARNNDSGAQDWLGLKYSVGDGVPKDLIVAEHWLRLAAEQGNISSQISLARLLLDTGDDDSQRLERWAAGFKWLTVCHALAASEKIYALSEKDEIKSKARLKNADHFLFVSEHELKDKRKVQVIAQRPEGERQARAWLEIHQRR